MLQFIEFESLAFGERLSNPPQTLPGQKPFDLEIVRLPHSSYDKVVVITHNLAKSDVSGNIDIMWNSNY